MAKTPKPWFRKGRGWFVTINGKQHNLGRNKEAAHQQFYRLMQMPLETQRIFASTIFARSMFSDGWIRIRTFLAVRDAITCGVSNAVFAGPIGKVILTRTPWNSWRCLRANIEKSL